MKNRSALEIYKEGGAWWETEISHIQKNSIAIRGYPIEELIGELSYPQMLYLLLVGELLDDSKAALLKVFLSQVRTMDQERHLLQQLEWR